MKIMEELRDRSNFWSEHYYGKCQGTSEPHPFLFTPKWHKLYHEKKVLEIGPGEGRQSDILMFHTKEYSVADISTSVLNQERYKNCKMRYTLTNWFSDLGEQFDTICFWYILHHIKKSEGIVFFEFLSRNLKKNGHLHFNYPLKVIGEATIPDGDGLKTTTWTPDLVEECLTHCDFKFEKVNDAQNNHCIVKASVSDILC